MTERELMSKAYQIQNASNIKAVSRMLVEACDLLSYGGNDYIEEHPATIILIDKLASLCNIQDDHDKIMAAMNACGDVFYEDTDSIKGDGI